MYDFSFRVESGPLAFESVSWYFFMESGDFSPPIHQGGGQGRDILGEKPRGTRFVTVDDQPFTHIEDSPRCMILFLYCCNLFEYE